MKRTQIYLIPFLSVFLVQSMNAEQVVTTKKDEPDAYYGLDVRAVISPSYGYKIQNEPTALATTGQNAPANPYMSQNDRSGFSTPWTLLMISKTFQETGIQTELWGELIRNSQLTSDTRSDGGTKQNPYIISVRRASVKKTWETSIGSYTLNFGMQELPHTYTQWSNFWRWRYIDRTPLESLGFAPQPADIGLSATGKWSIVSSQLMVSNGEGYKEAQNVNSAGMDVSARLSVEPQLDDKTKAGIHLFYRKENAAGSAAYECYEGKTGCLPNDLNINTVLVKNKRALQSDTVGSEVNFVWTGNLKWNLGLGAFLKRQNGGEIRDRMQFYSSPLVYGKDSFGKSAYAWLSFGIGDFTILGRYERGTGSNGTLGTTETNQKEFIPGFGVPTSNGPLSTQIQNSLTETNLNGYSSKSSFRRVSVFLEWMVSHQFKLALGYSENKNFDSNGVGQNVYVDQAGNARTHKDYLAQFSGVGNVGVLAYSALDRWILLRATIEF
ncbi:hypothetical protein JWG44_18910 [Leptospira sp. 201903071]|uniref:hypothetical protein n=1 Tax=Leptospira ainazelensis TaxID=2810034 RepID=UPI001963A130|nr:hypothetical protein [Leptospira ainazelensis]MBM9502327.1 hypothetical protein [Leptospira ainazelensis]